MSMNRSVNKISPLPADWLSGAGLGATDLALARAHQRAAERLVDALFLLGGLVRRTLLPARPALAGLPTKRGHA